MLALQIVEWLVLIHVVKYDLPRTELSPEGGIVELYFWACTVTLLLQVTGVLLVLKEHYLTGGILQIASCLLHLPKGEGILGLLGGMKAIRYGRALTKVSPNPEKTESITVTQG